ncbi:hypothetical protein BMS3Bbin02_01619 [bacterium BMS3Bbin02]|nr:hypothetical protein BMS3Bbin02_01619 [bacterium BMS3Bbin02]
MKYESPSIAATPLDGTMQEMVYVSIVEVE